MSDPWEATWDSIRVELSSLANQLRASNPRLWFSIGRGVNETFPFWAYASFSASGTPGEEDIVVSISFKDDDGLLLFTSDAASGDGQILIDGPSANEPQGLDRSVWIEHQTALALGFVRLLPDALRELLRGEPDP